MLNEILQCLIVRGREIANGLLETINLVFGLESPHGVDEHRVRVVRDEGNGQHSEEVLEATAHDVDILVSLDICAGQKNDSGKR